MPARARITRWEADKVVNQTLANVGKALGRFGLVAETYAKFELTKGHGVLTGTLRRSIHTAQPGYEWSQDDIAAAPETPERGNQANDGEVAAGKVSLQLGSGLKYALPVHQGHGSFKGYHYLANGLAKAKPQLAGILEEFKV
jgi:hypothetical protein